MNPWTENRLLKRALAIYAGEHVLGRVLRDGDEALRSSCETVDASILFVDVGGFTMVSEPLTPDDLSDFISSWLELITNQIEKFGGILDTYIGDSALAWWGPEHQGDHAIDACRCAKAMVEELKKLNERFEARRWPTIKLKIGINSSHVRLGPYGTAKRLRFTVLGDGVNLASRLCGLANQQYEHPIVISEVTQKRIDTTISSFLIDTVRVKGCDEPMR